MIDTHGGGNTHRRRTYYGGGTTTATTSSDPITVPTFSNSGSSVSPVNANSTSAASNATNMQSNANAANDCYATGTCKGGRNSSSITWNSSFPPGSFGSSMTG